MKNSQRFFEKYLGEPVDAFASWVAENTKGFLSTPIGRVFSWLMVVGPLTLLPTAWEAWTAPNIDALRTATWPTMAIVDISAFLSVCQKGHWKIRLMMLLWIIMASAIWFATLVR